MSFPNRYFGVRMYADRYFGPVEDTGQFIAEVFSTVLRHAESSVRITPPTTEVVHLPSFVFIAVPSANALQRTESTVSLIQPSVATSDTAEASGAVPDTLANAEVTAEVTYFTIAEVEATVRVN